MQHIAVILELKHDFDRALLRGMQRYLVSKPWIYHIAAPDEELGAIMAGWRPAGILLIGRHVGPKITALKKRLKAPVVHLGWDSDEAPPATVMLDDVAIGGFAAEHLLALGAKHFAFFAPLARPTRVRRESGFRATLQAAGHEPHVYMMPLGIPNAHKSAHFDRAVTKWLTSLPTPIAILAGDDGGARDLTLICRKAGLRVPEDVVVLGVGDDELRCNGTSPPLSSVAIPAERMGFEAAAMLDRMLAGGARRRNPCCCRRSG